MSERSSKKGSAKPEGGGDSTGSGGERGGPGAPGEPPGTPSARREDG
jgi:hypothetical protein